MKCLRWKASAISAASLSNVLLEDEYQIAAHAREIYLQAGRTGAMPPPDAAQYGVTLNIEERNLLVNWYQNALSGS